MLTVPPYSATCRINKNSVDQSITGDSSGGTYTTVTFALADFDAKGMFDNANDRIVIPRSGSWFFSGQITYTSGIAAGNLLVARIASNGVAVSQSAIVAPGTADVSVRISDLISCAAGDLITLIGYKGGANSTVYGLPTHTFLSAQYVGKS